MAQLQPAVTVQGSLLCSAAGVVGAELSDGRLLSTITVAGDGVFVHDMETQARVASFAVGSAALKLEAPAVISVTQQACVALVADGQQGHKLASLPLPPSRAAAPSSKQQPSTAAGSIAAATAHSSAALPAGARGRSLHLLTPSARLAVPAVVAQDGTVHFTELHAPSSSPSAADLPALRGSLRPAAAPAAALPLPKLRGSCAWHAHLWTLHQASAGSPATVHEYKATAGGSASAHLRHVATHAVPLPPSSAGAHASAPLATCLHASASYLLVSWSCGTFTALKLGAAAGASSCRHLSPPAHFLANSAAAGAQPAGSPAAAGKRKAAAAAAGAAASGSGPVLAACPLDDTQLLVVCLGASTSQQQGSQQQQQQDAAPALLTYALVDVQFGCTLTTGTISSTDVPQLTSLLPTVATGVAQPTTLHLHSVPSAPGRALLQVGTLGVVALTVDAQPASLLALVGKGLATPSSHAAAPAPATAVDVAALMQLLTVQQQQQPAAAAAGGAAHEVVLHPLPPESAQAAQRPSLAAHATQLAASLRKALDEGKPAPPALLQEAVAMLTSQQQPGWATQVHLAPLVVSALAQAGEWARLQQVVEAAPGPISGCGQVLPQAGRAAQYHLLPLLSSRLDDVSPEHMVETLVALLSPGSAGAAAGAANGAGKAAAAAEEAKQVARARRQEYLQHVRSVAESTLLQAEHQVLYTAPVVVQGEGVQPSAQDADALVETRRAALALAQCAAAAVDGFTATQVLLHGPLSMPLDSAGLAAALRVLSGRQVEQLLGYLATWVDKYHNSLGAATASVVLPLSLLFPTYAQVLEWTRLVVDAHLARLLLAQDLPPSLTRLVQLTQQQVKVCQQLTPLAGAVEHVRASLPLPAAHMAAASQYTVQVISV